MTDSEFEQKIHGLPLTDVDKRDLLHLGGKTSRFPWVRVVLFLVFASLPLWIGWDGMVFILGDPPADTAEPVSARNAFATARQVGHFFYGVFWILAASALALSWGIARWNARVVRKIAALVPEKEQP